LGLAGSWAVYGIMRKRSDLGAIDGLTLETALYFPFALGYLIWRHHLGQGVLGHANLRIHLIVMSAGWVTALPLIFFAAGVRQIRLSTVGLLQYLTPTLQFFLGLLLYKEAFDAAHLKACLLIWTGLVLYSADSFWFQRGLFRTVWAARAKARPPLS
jgi:chloramphenicol-sensitive protein RarD